MLEVELKIEDKRRKTLESFQDIIENNYQNNENTSDYSIYDPTVLNLQRENFGATPESHESENKEDHLFDDEDDDVKCKRYYMKRLQKERLVFQIFYFLTASS